MRTNGRKREGIARRTFTGRKREELQYKSVPDI
jgi:hypothetical protein